MMVHSFMNELIPGHSLRYTSMRWLVSAVFLFADFVFARGPFCLGVFSLVFFASANLLFARLFSPKPFFTRFFVFARFLSHGSVVARADIRPGAVRSTFLRPRIIRA